MKPDRQTITGYHMWGLVCRVWCYESGRMVRKRWCVGRWAELKAELVCDAWLFGP